MVAWLFYRSVWGMLLFPAAYLVCVKKYCALQKEKRKEQLLMEFKDAMQSASAALLAGYSVIHNLGEYSDLFAEQGDEFFLLGVLVGCAIGVAVHIVIAGLLLFMIYRRADENPRLVYILLGLFRTNIFTIAFLQYSVNEMIEQNQSKKMEAV